MKIVYNDLEKNAPRVTWHGVTFLDGQPVEVDDPELFKKAVTNRFFTVDGAWQDDLEDAERERLLARATELGVKVDGRWKLERLRTAVQEAEAAL